MIRLCLWYVRYFICSQSNYFYRVFKFIMTQFFSMLANQLLMYNLNTLCFIRTMIHILLIFKYLADFCLSKAFYGHTYRFIPQGTVDINIGLDCLVGLKALTFPTIADNKPFDCANFVWKSLLCMVMSCISFRTRHSPYSYD